MSYCCTFTASCKLTVVMITHDLIRCFGPASRVGVIVDGRMITDTLDGMLQNSRILGYTSIFTARGARAAEKEAHG
jgi:ABC-type uncharacterized transport system ATPase component